MSVAISGMGWVTPLGIGLDDVWRRLMNGETGRTGEVLDPQSGRSYRCFQVDPKLVEPLGRRPRLRRSSAISYFTAAAGLAALENSGIDLSTEVAPRIAIIFAVASGGVTYTRRFYEKIAREGAAAASPLLFPETVYNAPASHLAAVLGIDGATYTLVGDASVGVAALKQGEQLLLMGEADHCLVVGGEELDWILCEAYRQWRLLTREPVVDVFANRAAGMVMSEGAAAVVLSPKGKVNLDCIDEGVPFFSRKEAPAAIGAVLKRVSADRKPGIIIASANGTFIDKAERHAIEKTVSRVPVYAHKAAIGEALGASALIQVIVAARALQMNELPPVSSSTDFAQLNRHARGDLSAGTALVSVLGLNQQASAVALSVG